MDELLKWAPLAITAINLAAGIFFWAIARTLVSKEAHQTVVQRVVRLEEGIGATPGWGALRRLGDQVLALEGEVKALGQRVEGMRATVSAEVDGLRVLLSGTRELLGVLNEHLLKDER